jgi:hypothetical protein
LKFGFGAKERNFALEGFFKTASADEVPTRLKKPALFTRIELECA